MAKQQRPPITVIEAGRRGGETCAERHGWEFYEENGRKGGRKVMDQYGWQFFQEIGMIGSRVLTELAIEGRELLGKGATHKECIQAGRDFRSMILKPFHLGKKNMRFAIDVMYQAGREILGEKALRTKCIETGAERYQGESAPITTAEAGRMGGLAVRDSYGHEHYVKIGRKGGQVVRDTYGCEFYKEIGAEGRATTAEIMVAGRKALGLPAK